MNPTTLSCAQLSQDDISSLRESTESYLARNGHQFKRIDKSTLQCLVCVKSLTAINSSHLDAHTKTKLHQFLGQFNPHEREEFTVETLKKYHQNLLKFDCLQLYHRSTLQCTLCCNVYFGVSSLTDIDKHMKEKHSATQKRKPFSEISTNLPSKRSAAAHEKGVYIQREIQRHNTEETQLLTTNQQGDLLCVCSQLFLPGHFSRYREIVQRHMTSCAKHERVLTGQLICLFLLNCFNKLFYY